MAEPAIAPAPEAPAAPPPEAVEPVGLLDALETLADETAETPEPAEGEKAAKPAPVDKKKPVAAPEKPKDERSDPESKLELDEALFTDEALSAPDGVARGAEVLKAVVAATKDRNRILDRYDIRIKRKAERVEREQAEGKAQLESERAAWHREIGPHREAAQSIVRELAILDPRSGASAVQRFDALSRLNGGMDGRQLYEEWTLGIAADGKVPAPSRAEAQLHARIEQLQQALQQKLEGDQAGALAAEKARMQGVVNGALSEIRTIASDAEKYPAIAAAVAKADDDGEAMGEVVEWVKRAIVKAHEKGRPIDKPTAIGRVEARLARLSGAKPADAAQAAESGNSEPGSPARGAGNGKTVLPALADRSTGNVRPPKSERERDAENLRDPAFLDLLPFLKS